MVIDDLFILLARCTLLHRCATSGIFSFLASSPRYLSAGFAAVSALFLRPAYLSPVHHYFSAGQRLLYISNDSRRWSRSYFEFSRRHISHSLQDLYLGVSGLLKRTFYVATRLISDATFCIAA